MRRKNEAVVTRATLIEELVLNWRIWEGAEEGVLDLLYRGLSSLIREDHPHQSFNIKQFHSASIVDRIFCTYKVHNFNSDSHFLISSNTLPHFKFSRYYCTIFNLCIRREFKMASLHTLFPLVSLLSASSLAWWEAPQTCTSSWLSATSCCMSIPRPIPTSVAPSQDSTLNYGGVRDLFLKNKTLKSTVYREIYTPLLFLFLLPASWVGEFKTAWSNCHFCHTWT